MICVNSVLTLYKCYLLFVLLFQGFAFMDVVFLVYNENLLEIKQPIFFSSFLHPPPPRFYYDKALLNICVCMLGVDCN